MGKLQNMRTIEIKQFRAVSSGWKTNAELWGDGGFQSAWVNQNQHLLVQHMYEPICFLWHDDITVPADQIKNTYILAVKDDVTPKDTEPYEIIEFPGGMFLVATADELDSDDLNETVDCMFKWINDSDVFECGDFPKSGMCNMPNPDGAIDKALGISHSKRQKHILHNYCNYVRKLNARYI